MVETGIDPRRIAAALADPALAPLADGPLLIVAGAPPQVVYATSQALALFRADTAAGLHRRLFAGDEPGARRLAHIALTLPAGAPRLERLRFFIDGASEALLFQCLRLQEQQGAFAAAAVGVRPGLIHTQPADAAPITAAITSPMMSPVSEPTLAAATTARRGTRFLWRADAEFRLTFVDAALCAALGRDRDALVGASLPDLARAPGFDPDGRLRDALAGRGTWSGVETWWPRADGSAACVMLGGLPLYDATRTFAGYSGFGLLHVDRTRPAEARAPTTLADEPMEPTGHDKIATPTTQDAQRPAADAPMNQSPPAADADLTTAAPANLEKTQELRGQAKEHVEAQERIEKQEGARDEAVPEIRKQASGTPTAALLAPNVVALSAWKTSAASGPGLAPISTDEASRALDAGWSEDDSDLVRLTPAERNAFRDIARALGARIEDSDRWRAARDNAELQAGDPSEGLEPGETTAVGSEPADHNAARRLLDRVGVGVMICRGGEAVFLNRTLLEMLGHDSLESFTDAGGLARMFPGRPPDAETAGGAVAVTTRDGETIALEGKLQSVEWEGGPAMLTTFRRPVEAEANARADALALQLEARGARVRELEAILDAANDGVAVLDAQGRIHSLNASAEALFGYAQNEVAGDAFTMLLVPDTHQEAIERLRDAGQTGQPGAFVTLTGRTRDGALVPLSVRIARVGESAWCAVMRDMSHWREAESALVEARRRAEEASALKSDFLAKISHEIRTPLNAIIGFAEVMLEERFGPPGNARYREYLKDIRASGAHVMSLVNDLLDLSKIEAGKLDLHLTPVDANVVLQECVSMMQAQAIQERVILRVALAPQFPHLVADERALRQIVLNLLSNAVKFNQPGGQVIVSTALADTGAAVLRVRDTGLGMTDSEIETALEPFRQIRSGRQTTGTGLGLPLTKALVEAHQASFSITSRKGEGTLVEIAFPETMQAPHAAGGAAVRSG